MKRERVNLLGSTSQISNFRRLYSESEDKENDEIEVVFDKKAIGLD